MKELRGTATALVPARLEQCLALVEAVNRYPDSYPDVVRSVEVLEWDIGGVPSRARTKLHVAVGPLTKDFDLLMSVTVEPPATVKLVKVSGNAKFDGRLATAGRGEHPSLARARRESRRSPFPPRCAGSATR